MSIRRSVLGLSALCAMAALSKPLPSFAVTPAEALASIQAAKLIAPGAALDVWVVGNQVIIVTTADMTAADGYLGKQAAALAQTIFAPANSTAKQVSVIFADKSGSKAYRAFNLDAAQTAEIQRIGNYDPRSVPATSGERGTIAGATMGAMRVETAAVTAYQAKRAALMVRINMLKGKGVGVKPYTDQIAQIDERMRTSGAEAAAIALGALEKTVGDQEKVSSAAQGTAAGGAGAGDKLSSARSDMDALVDSMKDFNGSSKDYEESLKAAFMKKELGDLYVHKGPFVVERVRIAQQIHTMETQGKDMSGYKTMFNQIENNIKDPRKIRDIVPQLQYLQSQLGVKQLGK